MIIELFNLHMNYILQAPHGGGGGVTSIGGRTRCSRNGYLNQALGWARNMRIAKGCQNRENGEKGIQIIMIRVI